MLYYLETNSLRRLISKLDNKVLIRNSYTSILSIIELISGINDEITYNTRKGILDKILKSKLTICLNLPETLITKSFGFNINDDEIVSGIRRIISFLIKSKSYIDFYNGVKDSPDKQYHDFIVEYDEKASIFFRDFFIKKINIARENPGFKKLIHEYNLMWSSKDKILANNLYFTLIDLFSHSLLDIKQDIDKRDIRTIDEIKSSYDHSIDIFVTMSSIYSFKNVSFGNVPGKNDHFDLYHLLYLDSIRKIIVSDDKLLHNLFVKSFSKIIISTDDFIIKNNI